MKIDLKGLCSKMMKAAAKETTLKCMRDTLCVCSQQLSNSLRNDKDFTNALSGKEIDDFIEWSGKFFTGVSESSRDYILNYEDKRDEVK